MEIKEKKSFGEIICEIFAFITLFADVILLLMIPQNAWIIIFGLIFAGIFLNIGNILLAKVVCDKYNLHPMLLLLINVVLEIVIILASMFFIMSQNNGEMIACADSCNKADFFETFGMSFLWAQLFFIGGYVCYIVKSFGYRKETKF